MGFLDDDGVTKLTGLIKAKVDELALAIRGKQDKLLSGTNIKTLNGNSLLGSGNITITVTDSTAYQVRRDSASLVASDSSGFYRLWFTSVDGTMYVPINKDTSSSYSTSKTINTRPINPFGMIFIYTSAGSSGSKLRASYSWTQARVLIGYSYVLSLTVNKPVYLKCSPQNDGGVVIQNIVQTLPADSDGFVYIFLGIASNSSELELCLNHPVYYHDGTGIRLWTGVTSASGVSS